MHDIHIPMRWADLDQLNHVNNVVYVDYAMEAHARLVDDGELERDRPIRHVRVDFMRPLLLSSKPVLVRSIVDGDDGDPRDPLARRLGVVQHHRRRARRAPSRRMTGVGRRWRCRVRRSDVGPDGTVTLTRLFELFQEISASMRSSRVIPHRVAGRFVVGRVELDLGEPLPWRRDPYPVQTHIAHVSRSSFRSMTRIDGGRYGSATATLVGFDLDDARVRCWTTTNARAPHRCAAALPRAKSKDYASTVLTMNVAACCT